MRLALLALVAACNSGSPKPSAGSGDTLYGVFKFCGKWHAPSEIMIECRDPAVTDLMPLTNTQAIIIDLDGTAVTDLRPLATADYLINLSLRDVPVVDLSPLAGLPLQILEIPNTRVADLGPVRTLASLQHLNVSGTFVTDLSPLVGLKRLTYLDISTTLVTDLSPLAHVDSLTILEALFTMVDTTSLHGRAHEIHLDFDDSVVANCGDLQREYGAAFVICTPWDVRVGSLRTWIEQRRGPHPRKAP